MKRLVIILAALAPLALGGCSSLFSGVAVGGAGGFDGPGAAAVGVVQTPNGCPNLDAQGSIPANAIDVSCERLADGTIRQKATIGALTPENVLLAGMKAQAEQAAATAALLQQIAPILAKAAGTAFGGPAGGIVAGAIVPPPAIPPLPTLPGPAAQ